MSDESAPQPTAGSRRPPSYFKNWLSLAGAVTAMGSLFAFVFLVAIDIFAHNANPYLGILTYLVAPAFLILGLCLIFAGWWWQRRQIARHPGVELPALTIDLSRPRDRKYLFVFGSGAVIFLLLSAFGSYQTYQFTESVQFCGETCHTVMKPEFTTYQHGPHARVACADCHIGSGASWYVKSKISGAYQVYATIFDKYPRPIPVPVKNLRPAQETCEQCHWPDKFTGNLDRSFHHYLSDKANTPYTVRLLLHVGGGQPGGGFFGGIHWHMNVANKVEYYASDAKRQVIPWVRETSRLTGEVKVFRSPGFKGDPPPSKIRVMDCIDCHNRPAHDFKTANEAVEEQMYLGHISRKLPFIKRVAVAALSKKYKNDAQAMEGIATALRAKYHEGEVLSPTIAAVQRIYRNNFFPAMKADWRDYPNNIGHLVWPGCFRCHDGEHKTADGQETIPQSCNTCHTILAQGHGAELAKLSPEGLKFEHPGGDYDPALTCSDCHNGGNQ